MWQGFVHVCAAEPQRSGRSHVMPQDAAASATSRELAPHRSRLELRPHPQATAAPSAVHGGQGPGWQGSEQGWGQGEAIELMVLFTVVPFAAGRARRPHDCPQEWGVK